MDQNKEAYCGSYVLNKKSWISSYKAKEGFDLL